jgi:hypothetical protein
VRAGERRAADYYLAFVDDLTSQPLFEMAHRIPEVLVFTDIGNATVVIARIT